MMIRAVVDFPEPDAPTNANAPPCSILNDRSCTASMRSWPLRQSECRLAYHFDNPLASSSVISNTQLISDFVASETGGQISATVLKTWFRCSADLDCIGAAGMKWATGGRSSRTG